MIHIRTETTADYAAIARVHARAFVEEPLVALIVDYHRHRAMFDPELSLVAEVDGQVVGHILFSPRTFRVLGQDVHGLNLSPLGVDPQFQNQGIGGELVRAGHEIARSKGYVLSVVLGHPEYYPRFGYLNNAYGSASLTMVNKDVPQSPRLLVTRKVIEADFPALQALWRTEEDNVDLAIVPGDRLLDWISTNPSIESTVYEYDGEIVGYSRVHSAHPQKVRYFLAAGEEAARVMAHLLMKDMDTIELPLHPHSASSRALSGVVKCEAWGAGMAMSLLPNPFDDYYARLQQGACQPGRPIWPVEFDIE
ncbi:MAG: N-acetyltransferase [Anaerolineae bacterium]